MIDASRVECAAERLGDMLLSHYLGEGRGAISPV